MPVLTEPSSLGAAAGDRLEFTKRDFNGDPADEPDFLGFEIYYKIYEVTDSIDTGILTIDDLLARSFRRITQYVSPSVASSPLIPIATDLTSQFTIYVDFSGDLSDTTNRPRIYTLGPPPTPDISIPDFRRAVNYPGSDETKRFTNFESDDDDIDADIWADLEAGIEVVIAAYVLSYGATLEFGAIYSIPVYMGAVSLELPLLPR